MLLKYPSLLRDIGSIRSLRCTVEGLLILGLVGCSSPVGVKPVSQEDAYRQATRSSLAGDEPSHESIAVLHRHNLLEAYEKDPAKALQALQRIAMTDSRRDLLFTLSEMNFAWARTLDFKDADFSDPTRAQSIFMQAALYAYLYLLGPGNEPLPSPFDNRFRAACEIYNRSLDLAFRRTSEPDQGLDLTSKAYRLPAGTLNLELAAKSLNGKTAVFEGFYPADAYEVFGLTTMARSPGLGLPIIGLTRKSPTSPNGGVIPLTAFLRVEGGIAELQSGHAHAQLELYSSYDDHSVIVAGREIPLQSDTTTPLAYRLDHADMWNQGLRRFLGGGDVLRQVLMIQPYEPGRIPVVLVHGTGSHPVWWAEMLNTLRSDPEIRTHFQFWFYDYNSSLPVAVSAANLRDSLTEMVQQLDPHHQDAALQQMVVIGHSQGGLLTHLTAVRPGQRFWQALSDQPFEQLDISPTLKQGLARSIFFEPLPFVKRVVFISTPHRGSFLTKGWVRDLARRVISMPLELVQGGAEEFHKLSRQLKISDELKDSPPNAVDGMSDHSPILQVLSELPFKEDVKAHSIVAVLPGMDIKTGDDGVVEYKSAHLDGVESELVVRSGHSAQGHPVTIEEVRRILLKHCNGYFPSCAASPGASQTGTAEFAKGSAVSPPLRPAEDKINASHL